MTPLIALMALSAAVLTAVWNAMLRSGTDRLKTVTIMSVPSTLVAVVLVMILPAPQKAAWPAIVLSAVLQVGYSVFLVAAYKRAELGQVYPVTRGTVPLLVLLGSVVLAGEHVTMQEVIGVAAVACAIISLACGKGRGNPAAIGLAILTGSIIASYNTVDSIGVRVSGNSGAYAAWVLLLYGALLPLTFVTLRGRLIIDMRAPETMKAVAAGSLAMITYGLTVLAFALGPAGPISALRETSVVFAAIVGWLVLGETLTTRRIAACLVVTAGAVLIAL